MHEKDVLQVAWNPKHPSVLASSGADRQILIWNLKNIGEEQTPEDMEDGPPELMVIRFCVQPEPIVLTFFLHSSCTVVIQAKFQIWHGTRATTGKWPALPKTMFCKSGR